MKIRFNLLLFPTVLRMTLSVANANDLHVFGREGLGALGEVAHDGEQPPEVELKERLGVHFHLGLQTLMQASLTFDLGVVVGIDKVAVVHSVAYGLQHQVAVVQVFGVLGCVQLEHVVRRHLTQQAGDEHRLLHVVHRRVVAIQGQKQGAAAQLDIGRLHGSRVLSCWCPAVDGSSDKEGSLCAVQSMSYPRPCIYRATQKGGLFPSVGQRNDLICEGTL